MGLTSWLGEHIFKSKMVKAEAIGEESIGEIYAELFVRELAFWACVNLMAKTVSKCEFKTFYRGKEIKGDEYFLWNYSPNKNQSSTVFLNQLISTLYRENEVLIVEASGSGQLLVAEGYQHEKFALQDDVFKGVTARGFTFSREFYQPDVLFVRLNEQNMRPIINGVYACYEKLLNYGMKAYQKSRGMKGTLEVDAAMSGTEEERKKLDELFGNSFKTFAQAENSVLRLNKGLKYNSLTLPGKNEGTRDIRAMIDDVFDITAKGFGIPPALLSGKVAGTEDAVDDFLTFAVDPLVKLLETEINRKRYSKREISEGSCIKINTRAIKHIDVMDAPAGIEKLISSGVYCVNDIRILLGEPIIDEPWAWQHYITKNFEEIAGALHGLKGGESE